MAIFTCSLLVASCCCTALQGQGVSFQYIAEDSTIEYTESGAGEGDVAFHIVQDGGPPDVVMAWSMGVNFDPDQLFLYGVNPGSSVAEFNGGLGPDFWMTEEFDSGFLIGCVYCTVTCGGGAIFDGMQEVAVAHLSTVSSTLAGNTTGSSTMLTFGPQGTPPTINFLSVGGISVAPELIDGTVDLVYNEPLFSRGDVNADGAVEAIPDAVALLIYLHIPQPIEICQKAADVNNSGNLNIADPVYLLNFGFLSGPAPAAPFPDCAQEIPASDLGCDRYPPCP